jgi:hypothetical protein
MVRRIISGAHPVSATTHDVLAGHGRRANLVIADWGRAAELLVFPSDEPVAMGAEFHYRGSLWVITGSRRDSQIMVAEPISH